MFVNLQEYLILLFRTSFQLISPIAIDVLNMHTTLCNLDIPIQALTLQKKGCSVQKCLYKILKSILASSKLFMIPKYNPKDEIGRVLS